MQAIKEKLNDMSHMRKVKAEAREEEREEKEMAKTRVQVAKELRMAKEAEAAMDLHVSKAAEKVAKHEAKCSRHLHDLDQQSLPSDAAKLDSHGHSRNSAASDPPPSYDRHDDDDKFSQDAVHGVGPTNNPGYSTGTHSLI